MEANPTRISGLKRKDGQNDDDPVVIPDGKDRDGVEWYGGDVQKDIVMPGWKSQFN